MIVKPMFVLASDGDRAAPCRAVLDGFPGKVYVEFGVRPSHKVDPLRGHQHLFARPPVMRTHLKVSNGPGFIIDDEVPDVTDLTGHRSWEDFGLGTAPT